MSAERNEVGLACDELPSSERAKGHAVAQGEMSNAHDMSRRWTLPASMKASTIEGMQGPAGRDPRFDVMQPERKRMARIERGASGPDGPSREPFATRSG
jgi:hypothetical protein